MKDLRPVTFGVVRLDPGGYRSVLDSAGAFQFAVPDGRYYLRVRAGGYPETADSLTLGRDGLQILAAVGQSSGDIVVRCPTEGPVRTPPGRHGHAWLGAVFGARVH